jgi:hypothetical protein
MFTRESQELAARRIAEIKRQLAERKNHEPVPPAVPPADDEAPF